MRLQLQNCDKVEELRKAYGYDCCAACPHRDAASCDNYAYAHDCGQQIRMALTQQKRRIAVITDK